MAKNKTTENENSVTDYINAIGDPTKRNDCAEITRIITKELELEPKMWGTGIVGFGSYHYKYDSGHEGDAPVMAFAARANDIVFYFCSTFDQREVLLQQFGKYRGGKGCIYIKKLEHINVSVLVKMIKSSVSFIRSKYPS